MIPHLPVPGTAGDGLFFGFGPGGAAEPLQKIEQIYENPLDKLEQIYYYLGQAKKKNELPL